MMADDFEIPGREQNRWGIGEYFGRGVELGAAAALVGGGWLVSLTGVGAIVGVPIALTGGAIGLNALRGRR